MHLPQRGLQYAPPSPSSNSHYYEGHTDGGKVSRMKYEFAEGGFPHAAHTTSGMTTDDEEYSEGEDYYSTADAPMSRSRSHGARSGCSCARICCIGVLSVVAFLLVSFVGCVAWAEMSSEEIAETVGSRSFGTDTKIGSVNVALFNQQTTMTDVRVANPPGFEGDFLVLRDGLFDTDLWSIMNKHVEFKTFYMDHLTVKLQQNGTMRPNFVYILENLHIAKLRPSAFEPPDFLGGKLSQRRYIVDKLEMRDVTLLLDAQLGLSIGNMPVGFGQPIKIKKVVLNNVGKKEGGIPMARLLLIMVHSLVSSAVETAPDNVRQGMISAVEAGVQCLDSLDASSLHLDPGSGLKDISELMQRLGRCNQTVAEDQVSPNAKKTGAALNSMIDQANEANKEMGKTFNQTIDALGNAMGSPDGKASMNQAMQAMNNTAAAMGDAVKGMLSGQPAPQAQPGQKPIGIEEAMASAMNSSAKVANDLASGLGLVATTPPPLLGDLNMDAAAVGQGAGAASPGASPASGTPMPDLISQAAAAMGFQPAADGSQQAPLSTMPVEAGQDSANAFQGLPAGAASGAAPSAAAAAAAGMPQMGMPPAR
eukprot:TRINITY_DN80387_c0_g1_i1.p1 TRINITY_DN80387_c0_g1~~TRINITY_DN80387_c0_g1_i1.p1  ORF type:complete len:592 (-),score=158.82 TRINITY_DN80387_c0_g1_i1:157-1932(-)